MNFLKYKKLTRMQFYLIFLIRPAARQTLRDLPGRGAAGQRRPTGAPPPPASRWDSNTRLQFRCNGAPDTGLDCATFPNYLRIFL